MARRKKAKRTLSAEQLQKMQAGKARAREERERQKERADMLSDLDQRLAEGRRTASGKVRMPGGRRRRYIS